jgi:hypothetical protein
VKLRLLPLFLIGAASAVLAEDSSVLLNQRFQLHFNQWQMNQGPTTASTQAVYEVEAGMPVMTYRLGALVLNGAVEYNRLSYGSAADSQTSLSRYGLRVNLFPYRPFRLYLDYQRSQTPDLFDSGKVVGRVWGAGASYGGRFLNDVRVSYRHGSSELAEMKDEWSLWRLEANQRIGTTQMIFQATRQEYETLGSTFGWRMFMANLDTETNLGGNWLWRTRSQAQDNQQSRWYDMGTTLYGPIAGSLHSLTTLSGGASLTGDYRTGNSFGSESLVLVSSRWNAHVSGAFSQSATPSAGSGARVGSAALGTSYDMSQDWRVHGDVGASKVRQTLDYQDSARTTTTVNLGVARGGDVPELIRHTLFFLSDWSYDRRVREEYPPDFLPTELAQEMMRRRMRQTGSFGFTADLWRMKDNVSNGRVDWARVTGQAQTRGNFTLYLAGDYKKDLEMTLPGIQTTNTDLLANSNYRLGETTLSSSLGYSDSHRRITPAGETYGYAWMGTPLGGASRHFSLGLSTRVGKVPCGFIALRYAPAEAPSTTSLSTWADLTFRQVSVRFRYETSRMDNGFRSNRITVDLLRWFDTVAVGSLR